MPTTKTAQYSEIADRIEALQDEISDAWQTVSSEEEELRIEGMEHKLAELQERADELNPALAFARWLQAEIQVIGEDVDIDRLYRQWRD